MEEKSKQIFDIACKLLEEATINLNQKVVSIQLLAGDGSQRQFYRLFLDNDATLIAVMPSGEQQQGRQEAFSAWNIGNHLYNLKVPVPKPYGFDNRTGLILFEDLEDVLLFDFIQDRLLSEHDRLFEIYQKIVPVLVHMQISGRSGFDPSWCWQTKYYDRQLMLERESDYFRKALCEDLLGIFSRSGKLDAELENIADHAAMAPADFFLHRDFQSRNIMIRDNHIRIIDFQGGRLGPLGYDLASLLVDPYVGMPASLQADIVDEYIKVLVTCIPYDPEQFRTEFYFLSLQRNLQILGAFAFLSSVRKKDFFRPFIRPALLSLQSLLANPLNPDYPELYNLTEQCLEKANTHDI